MKVLIYGAGSIGCYIGAVLHKQGVDVTLLGRQSLKDKIQYSGGIRLSDYEGRNEVIKEVPFKCEPDALQEADVILITLKCTAMEVAARELAQFANPNALIVCLQNGLGADEPIRRALPNQRIELGIVPFNVLQNEDANFHRSTEGSMHFSDASELLPIQRAYDGYGLGCQMHTDINAVVWGKLQLNLNNAINALSNIPLKAQLEQRGFRIVLAKCQEELLSLAHKKNITMAKLTAVKPHMIPKILRLPNFMFKLVAQKMLTIDPTARSSMWEDIQKGRPTEIDFLNGAIARIAKENGIEAPVNRKITELVRAMTDPGRFYTAEELVNEIGL